MSAVRNLPLAARLAAAGGALCLGLAVIAVTGVAAMNGLNAKTKQLSAEQVRGAELVGAMTQRSKENMALSAEHLYVYDGDLATEDRLAAEMRANWAENVKAGAELRRILAGTPAERAFSDYTALAAEARGVQVRAVARSRQETVRNVEERDGSRALFTETLIPLDRKVETAAGKVARATADLAEEAKAAAAASASSSTKSIILAR